MSFIFLGRPAWQQEEVWVRPLRGKAHALHDNRAELERDPEVAGRGAAGHEHREPGEGGADSKSPRLICCAHLVA